MDCQDMIAFYSETAAFFHEVSLSYLYALQHDLSGAFEQVADQYRWMRDVLVLACQA